MYTTSFKKEHISNVLLVYGSMHCMNRQTDRKSPLCSASAVHLVWVQAVVVEGKVG
jgi:hypothetical protein